MKRILFIINPISGVGRQKLIEKQTVKILDATKCSYDFVYTQRPRHAEELARKEERVSNWEHSNDIYGLDKFEDAKVEYWYLD